MGAAKQPVSAAAADVRSNKHTLRIAAGWAVAAACLIWVFHDVHPRKVLESLVIARWRFVAPAIAFDVATYVLQGARWSLLLRPVGRITTWRATQAIYTGLFTNEMLPLRVGEGVRAYLVSRWMESPLRAVLPSMLVERLLDAVCLLTGAAMAAIFVPLPHSLELAGDVLGAVVALGIAGFVFIVVREERHAKTQHQKAGVRGFVAEIASGLRSIGFSRKFWIAVALSVGLLAFQGLATWFAMLAFGLSLPVVAGMVVLFIIRLGTAIPNAPANVGSFQFFAVVALAIYGVEKTTAAGFSIVFFLILTVPLWTLGLASLIGSGTKLSTLKHIA
jgi:glycosyltransferase 2 family protein